MKIAILSDIHSNIYALQAVINDAKSKSVDLMINAGDSFYGPIEPRATYELLRENNFVNICGNQDREILEASLEQLENNPTLKYAYEQLGEEVLYWIQDLPFEKFLGKDLYVTHGTQHDDSVYLLEDLSTGKPVLRDENKIIELLDDVESRFVVCGHSHTPRCVNLSTGQVVINPGSVGLQAYKENQPNEHIIENAYCDATYIILDVNSSEYNIELVKVVYDYEQAALKAESNGREDWAYTLRTGKILPNS
ncbi:metallophosphoesterase [Arcobacter sp. F2176]|uniref:metallophosphoesterase family protein n=1 Tax=Arcobacter sp. F2176 TaxID=2044511 RepID=UPI00100B5EAB|nr:metallophosphoesterase family protein [Arcobacter sp. F2176]RXJ82123.1 metallophosphatase family protein [Arcobacter sp. F2176]